jgi:non-ribosomal peptide synthetase component F
MANSIRKVLRQTLADLDLPSSSNETPAPHQRRADEHVVTIVLDRGVKSIASVHAVMLERCAYSAFDVGEPVEKLQIWVEVSRPPIMISNSAVLENLGLRTLLRLWETSLAMDLALKKTDSEGKRSTSHALLGMIRKTSTD